VSARALLLVAACLAAVACSRQDAAWHQAEAHGTESGYQSYLESYPDGLYAHEARRRLARLQDDREWSRAERLGTPESYQRYLSRYPEGARAKVAQERLAVFLQPPVSDADAAAPQADIEVTAPAARDHWLQLGAFVGGEPAAEAAWQRLAAEHPQALQGLGHRIIRTPLGSGDLWRLFAGPVPAGEGEARCAAIRFDGGSCLLRAELQVMNRVTK
jgi:hypothetical protein